MSEQTPQPTPENSGLTGLDLLIARAAREGAADSFGPYFVERTVERMSAARSAARGARGSAARVWRGSWSSPQAVLRGLLRPAIALAAIALLLTVGDRFRTRTVDVPPGATQLVTLPDGSEATLTGGSSIAWRPFSDVRAVDLEGEAFFAVVSDSIPFEVSTFNARVVVTGTRFNVRAWPGALQAETWVALEEGGVRLEQLDAPRQAARSSALTLTPGQSAVARNSGLELAAARRIEDDLAWRSGGLALLDIPLADALDALERRFDVTLTADAALRHRPTSFVTPHAMDLEEILDAICFALDLQYRPILGGFHIESNQ